MAKADLTAARLRELLEYDPLTGAFTWKVTRKTQRPAGTAAGGVNACGYITIGIYGRRYTAHRLAWLHVTGRWPENHIDHVNGMQSDNRFCNLRDVTRSVNMQNRRRARKDSTSGLYGVSWDSSRQKWQAKISTDGVAKFLGRFSSPEEAHSAYLAAKRALHPGGTI